MASGYSGTPLWKKLGIKTGFRIRVANEPVHYRALISPLPDEVEIGRSFRKDIDLWHIFTASYAELKELLAVSITQIRQDGMIWVSWPKKASGVSTDIVEGLIREAAFPLGLVDVKVCAVDEVWSGLKLVIRKENRK